MVKIKATWNVEGQEEPFDFVAEIDESMAANDDSVLIWYAANHLGAMSGNTDLAYPLKVEVIRE